MTPPSGAYVGAKPKIVIEVSDPAPGSGIDTGTITVTIDGTALTSHPYSDDKITITPTGPGFSKGNHTVVVNVSDRAGNAANTLTLTYNALNFDGTVTTLSPDPNPTTSEIMPGGIVYRYYKVSTRTETLLSVCHSRRPGRRIIPVLQIHQILMPLMNWGL